MNFSIIEEIFKTLKDLDIDNNEKLQEASRKIKDLVMHQEMPEDIKQDILESYDNLNIDDRYHFLIFYLF